MASHRDDDLPALRLSRQHHRPTTIPESFFFFYFFGRILVCISPRPYSPSCFSIIWIVCFLLGWQLYLPLPMTRHWYIKWIFYSSCLYIIFFFCCCCIFHNSRCYLVSCARGFKNIYRVETIAQEVLPDPLKLIKYTCKCATSGIRIESEVFPLNFHRTIADRKFVVVFYSAGSFLSFVFGPLAEFI